MWGQSRLLSNISKFKWLGLGLAFAVSAYAATNFVDVNVAGTTTTQNLSVANPVSNLLIDTSLNMQQIVTPSNPAAGRNKLYFKSDNILYRLTSAGTETAVGVGETNTASNVGAGSQLFKQKTGVDLEFRSLTEGANIALTQNTDDVSVALEATLANPVSDFWANTINARHQGQVKFQDADSSNSAAIRSPATIATDYILTLPDDDGTASQVLTTDGSGVLTWTTPAPAGANTALSNLTTTSINQNLLPDVANTRSIGSVLLPWSALTIGNSGILVDSTGGDTQINSFSFPSGAADVSALRSSTSPYPVGIQSINNSVADATPTGNALIETGNKLAGTGNSGTISLQTGSSVGGTRGHVQIVAPHTQLNGTGTVAQPFRFYEGNNGNYAAIQSPTLAADYTLTLPVDDGTAGQVLSTDGSGVLSWISAGSSDPLLLGNGTAGAPTYSFSADPDTGMYRFGANDLGFSAGGALVARIGAGGGLLPGSDNVYELGTTTTTWLAIAGRFINSIDPTLNQAVIGLDSSTSMTVSGASVQGRVNADYVTTGNKSIGMQTGSNGTADAVSTGSLYFETGSKGAGTGNSGGIFLQTGASTGGTRGPIVHQARTFEFYGAVADEGFEKIILGKPGGLASDSGFQISTRDSTGANVSQSLNIITGNAPGAGSTGAVNIIPGSSTSGAGGSVNVSGGGAATPDNEGSINLSAYRTKINIGVLGFTALAADPTDLSTYAAGDVYYNNVSNVLRFYDGAVWANVGSGASGANQTLSNLTNPTAINQNLFFDTGTTAQLATEDNGAGNSEALIIQSGDAVGGSSGNLDLRSGGSDTGTGIITIHTGNATSANINSGDLTMDTGNVTGIADSGGINITSGTVVDGTSGNITISTGAESGTGARGDLIVGNNQRPSTDGAYDLGTAANRYNDIYANQLRNPGGLNISAEGGELIFLVNDASGISVMSQTATAAIPIKFFEADNGNFAAIQAPTLSADYTLTLPVDDGTSGQFLQTNGSGVLSWASSTVASPLQISGTYSATTPRYSFADDTDTGMDATGGNLYFVNGGQARFAIAGNIFVAAASGSHMGTTSTPFADLYSDLVLGGFGSAAAPSFTFNTDADTGIYRIGANNLGVSIGGTNKLDMAATNTIIATHFRPDSNNTKELGSTSAPWSAVYGGAYAIYNSGALNGFFSQFGAGATVAGQSLASTDLTVNATGRALGIRTNDITTGSNLIAIGSGNVSTSGNSGAVYIGSGNVTGGAGDSGDVVLIPGTSSGGTRGSVNVNGHMTTTGTSPAVSACGTGPSIVGNDNAGRVTIGTANGATCTLTFDQAWATAPSCMVSNNTSAGIPLDLVSTTTTLTITGAFNDSDEINYQCVGF